MKMENPSLQDQLKNHLQTHRYLSYQDLELWCRNGYFGRTYKVDTGRRKIFNLPVKPRIENGATVGWEWAGEPPQVQPQFRIETVNSNTVKLIR